MGVSFAYGHRETSPKGRKEVVLREPSLGVCLECGSPRPLKKTLMGEIWLPLNGTWWHIHPGGVTCSPLCRALGGYDPGPFDALEG